MFKAWMKRMTILWLSALLALPLVACGASASNPPAAVPTHAPQAATTNVAPTLAPSSVAPSHTPTPSTASVTPTVTSDKTLVKKLNLNTAAEDDFLKAIPGFGSRMVREFLEYRPYVSIQQFRKELGKYVDAKQVAEYEKYVYVPIDVNKADAATLQQIPGLDATEAAELIAARPYANAAAFLVKLTKYVSEAELAIAKTYLSTP